MGSCVSTQPDVILTPAQLESIWNPWTAQDQEMADAIVARTMSDIANDELRRQQRQQRKQQVHDEQIMRYVNSL
jgi:GAF domain-containing protein|tara:strand:+ start:7798 stop:8019 length:222 start_codon:yes stop_codon:yes gene_type:complete